MEFTLLGHPEDGPTLDLDHRRFAYAGKFVMSSTGKAVAREDGSLLGAVAFNEDRTDADTAWLRYVTVREDRRGEGIGSRLCRYVTGKLHEAGYDTVRIAVNNPVAYRALYRAGFGYTGRETGIAELVLEHPGNRDTARYRAGYAAFADRELDEASRTVLERHQDGEVPPVQDPPD